MYATHCLQNIGNVKYRPQYCYDFIVDKQYIDDGSYVHIHKNSLKLDPVYIIHNSVDLNLVALTSTIA